VVSVLIILLALVILVGIGFFIFSQKDKILGKAITNQATGGNIFGF